MGFDTTLESNGDTTLGVGAGGGGNELADVVNANLFVCFGSGQSGVGRIWAVSVAGGATGSNTKICLRGRVHGAGCLVNRLVFDI